MWRNHKLYLAFGLLLLAALAIGACAPAEPERVEVEVTREVEVPVETVVEVPGEVPEVEPEPITRTGGWLDTVVFVEEPSSDAGVTRLEVGDIDVYAYNISEPDIAARVFASDNLAYETAYGNYNDLTFMPSAGPEFEDGRLNPFFSDKIREAMNWLIDRDFIAQEITGGLARPRFVPINFASKDSALLADSIAAIELKYAHNPEKAVEVIDAEMEALGATKVDGVWNYNGEPVTVIGLIRVEDERREIGDYVANLLEDIGFVVQRDYKTSAEASPCWLRGDPESGCAHYYTGGWVSTAISRDASGNFTFFYTPDGLPFAPWQAYSPTDEFYDLASRLNNSEYANLDERAEMMASALVLALEDSQRIWLKDDIGVAPHPPNVSLASDLSGSIYGSWLWGQTLKFLNEDGSPREGGSMTIAMPSLMTQPWNAVGGSNWVYDMMPMRGIQQNAVTYDPFTGLQIPNRLDRAEVVIETGLPVEQNLDWVTLTFEDTIEVPDDAWADWDAENQVFITAGERFPEGATTKSKVTMYYEEDFFDKVSWHDGSPFTLADMVIGVILTFDRAKEASPYYDEAAVSEFNTFMDAFKGWRITSEDPLVVEYYTDAFALDAENNVTDGRAMSPGLDGLYDQGTAAFHNMTIGLMAEAAGELALSADKAESLEIEWTSYIGGPSLDILGAKLDEAVETNFIPFEPTLGQYITTEEAATRYANLQEWFRRNGHYMVGTGPYYLQQVFAVEGTLILQHNPDYPDLATKWDLFASAPIPEVVLDGPATVGIGDDAAFDIFVEFQGQPYAVDDISLVKYLVFDATGNLAFVGEAEADMDGHWVATLDGDLTSQLEEGSNQFAAIVVSKRALVPVREVVQFVTQ